MTNRTDTLIRRVTAFALAAAVTAAMLGGVNALAMRDIAPGSLLTQHAATRAA